MKKKIFIFGSSSRITAAICAETELSQYDQIYLIGRTAPKWIQDKKNIDFLKINAAEDINFDDFFVREIKGIDYAGLVYLPSAQYGRISLGEMSVAQINEIIRVSLINAILVVRSFANSQPKNASIILFSSQAASFGGNKISAYAAAKGGVESFVKGAARELGQQNIRINAISPSLIQTDSYDKYSTDKNNADIIKSIPLGRLGTPEDISNAVAWLLSDKSTYINGTILAISGGR